MPKDQRLRVASGKEKEEKETPCYLRSIGKWGMETNRTEDTLGSPAIFSVTSRAQHQTKGWTFKAKGRTFTPSFVSCATCQAHSPEISPEYTDCMNPHCRVLSAHYRATKDYRK